jgi:magnesium-protoporphyrin O-methyltransferase
MRSCHCDATDRHFTVERAKEDLAAYWAQGPTGTAKLILESLGHLGITADTLLDVGSGVGVLHHELLDRGVGRAVHLEAAGAYVLLARGETLVRGHEGRVTFIHGDLIALGDELPSADLVILDRVVCCYPDLEPMISISTRKARQYYVLSYPHDRWYIRGHTRWQNYRRRRAGNSFRTFVHPVARIRELVRAAGFHVLRLRRTLVWEVLICGR